MAQEVQTKDVKEETFADYWDIITPDERILLVNGGSDAMLNVSIAILPFIKVSKLLKEVRTADCNCVVCEVGKRIMNAQSRRN